MSPQKEKNHKKKVNFFHSIRFNFVIAMCFVFIATNLIGTVIVASIAIFRGFGDTFISTIMIILSMALVCVVIGTAITYVVSNKVLEHINRIKHGMQEISNGNFKYRVKISDTPESPTEFGELERTFNKMASELEGIELFRNDFINDFSHEFKTPIVSIKGFANQLKNPNLSEEQKRECIEIISSEAQRLASMSSNVLLLTKLENQQLVSDKVIIDVSEQIRNTFLLLEKQWSNKNIELDLDGLDDVYYTFNEDMLQHVWINLISNAIKFSPEGGMVKVTLKRVDDSIVFSVKDYGAGMNEETKLRIFDKFFQGDSSHSSEGNGIGLSIVRRIVNLANGHIEIISAPGRGSEFIVTLPD